MGSLEVGGRERVVLDLALRARAQGLDHRLLLFDAPFRPGGVDFDPEGVPWEFLRRGPGLDLRFARRLRRFVTEGRYDALHAHNDTAIAYAALAGLPLRRVPTFGTFHTKPGHDTPNARRLTRWASRRLDGVVAVSEELSAVLTELGWSRRPDVLWNGVDLDRFSPGPEARADDAPLRVVCLARADPIKRAEDLVRAALRAHGDGARLTLTVAGNGPLFADLDRLRAELDPAGHVVSLVERVADVPALLGGADVFCLVSDHEAAPRSLLEAMACGLACVVTEVGGMPLMLDADSEEPAGLLVPPRAVDELARQLGKLATDRDLRRSLGRRARARAHRFSAAKEWADHVALWSGAH